MNGRRVLSRPSLHFNFKPQLLFLVLLVLSVIQPGEMVKQADFKTCAQSGFCKRQRAFSKLRDLGDSSDALASYSLVKESLTVNLDLGTIQGTLMSRDTLYVLRMTAFDKSMRLTLEEAQPVHKVYKGTAEFTLEQLPSQVPLKWVSGSTKTSNASLAFGQGNLIRWNVDPLLIQWSVIDVPVVTFNERGYLNYEKSRLKQPPPPVLENQPADGSTAPEQPQANSSENLSDKERQLRNLKSDLESDLWEETFSGKTDSKPRGRRPLTFDAFHSSDNIQP